MCFASCQLCFYVIFGPLEIEIIVFLFISFLDNWSAKWRAPLLAYWLGHFAKRRGEKFFLWFLRIFVPRMINSIVGRLSKWFAYVFFVSGDRGNFPKYSRCYLSTINWFIFETIGLRLHSKNSLIFGAFVSVREFSWMHVMFVKINEISGNFFRRVFQDARSKYF